MILSIYNWCSHLGKNLCIKINQSINQSIKATNLLSNNWIIFLSTFLYSKIQLLASNLHTYFLNENKFSSHHIHLSCKTWEAPKICIVFRKSKTQVKLVLFQEIFLSLFPAKECYRKMNHYTSISERKSNYFSIMRRWNGWTNCWVVDLLKFKR